MAGESKEEIAEIIESEIAALAEPKRRYEHLFQHCRELAERWSAFAKLGTISAEALIANDLFRALTVCLRMTLESLSRANLDYDRPNLELLVAMTCDLDRGCDHATIKRFDDLLRTTFTLVNE